MTSRRFVIISSTVTLCTLLVVSVFAELFVGSFPVSYEPGALTVQGLADRHAHTDHLFSWWILATRLSFGGGILSALGAVVLGSLLGAVAALGPSVCDSALARLIEFGTALPAVFLVPIVHLGAGLQFVTALVLAVVLGGTLEVARLVRGYTRVRQQRGFALATRALGGSGTDLVRRHLLTELISPLLVALALTSAAFVAMDATLSWLDLARLGSASWGSALVNPQRSGPFALAALSVTASTCSLYALARQFRPGSSRSKDLEFSL